MENEKKGKTLTTADQPPELRGKGMTVIIELEDGNVLSLVSPAFFPAGVEIKIARIGITDPYDLPKDAQFADVTKEGVSPSVLGLDSGA